MFRSKEKKLRAVARRMTPAADYDEEPTMKLSSAVFVVLILHVVALGGIFVFDKIRAERPVPLEAPVQASPLQAEPPIPNSGTTTADPDDQARTPARSAPAAQKGSDSRKPEAASTASEFYTVAKGDNLAAIARKLHVSSDALVRLNKIEEPKKLQIGQRLRIPQKKAAPKADE